MGKDSFKVLTIHGPNLNLTGRREPDIYGLQTIEDINAAIYAEAQQLDLDVDIIQSNHEGVIIDAIHQAACQYSCIIINAGAFTHYSIAIRDALAAVAVPAIEVHLSNIYKRESFRHHSVLAGVVHGQISGFGADSYLLALRGAARLIGGGNA